MLVIEGHSPTHASTESYTNVSFGDIVSGTTTYTATLAIPSGEALQDQTLTATRDPNDFSGISHLYIGGIGRALTNVSIAIVGSTRVATLTIPAALAVAGTAGLAIHASFIADTNLDENERHIFPADRCTWVQLTAADGSGYEVSQAQFFGLGNTPTTIANPRLGFIGKSGRFVEIAR